MHLFLCYTQTFFNQFIWNHHHLMYNPTSETLNYPFKVAACTSKKTAAPLPPLSAQCLYAASCSSSVCPAVCCTVCLTDSRSSWLYVNYPAYARAFPRSSPTRPPTCLSVFMHTDIHVCVCIHVDVPRLLPCLLFCMHTQVFVCECIESLSLSPVLLCRSFVSLRKHTKLHLF